MVATLKFAWVFIQLQLALFLCCSVREFVDLSIGESSSSKSIAQHGSFSNACVCFGVSFEIDRSLNKSVQVEIKNYSYLDFVLIVFAFFNLNPVCIPILHAVVVVHISIQYTYVASFVLTHSKRQNETKYINQIVIISKLYFYIYRFIFIPSYTLYMLMLLYMYIRAIKFKIRIILANQIESSTQLRCNFFFISLPTHKLAFRND